LLFANQPPSPSPEEKRAEKRQGLLEKVKHLYYIHGPSAISKAFLIEHGFYYRLQKLGIMRAGLLQELGIADNIDDWNQKHRTYRGKPIWTWERVVDVAKQEAEAYDGRLPTLEWFRKNHRGMARAIFSTGHSYEELRAQVGSFTTSQFRESRSGLRWRSQPECSLSDFLYARGIKHKRGERYADLNPEHIGQNKYDLHFLDRTGEWIDVEIWGNLENLSKGRYAASRSKKEAWRQDDPRFLGIESTDCLVEGRLEDILASHIGRIVPFVFDKPTDRIIETAHWSSSDELIESCRQLAAMQPDGLFPNEQWLRKRGRYKARPGEPYNTMAVRINQWLGGTRKVRELLDQAYASTNKWTPDNVVEAWRAFEDEYGITPAMAKARKGSNLPVEVLRRGSQIYQAATWHNVRPQVKRGPKKWTPQTIESEWNAFVAKHGKLPTQCMSAAQRRQLPRAIADEATQIYGAARKWNLVKKLRGKVQE
jgi:hypothetical protein